MVIHGGAGTILRQNMTSEMEKAYVEKELKVLFDEDRIAETKFRVVNEGGRYRPKIVDVRLKDGP